MGITVSCARTEAAELTGTWIINIQDPKEGRKILTDINTMVDYIEKNRTK